MTIEIIYEPRKATIEDAASIAHFNIQMALETENVELEKETVLKGVTNCINDSSKGVYYVMDYTKDDNNDNNRYMYLYIIYMLLYVRVCVCVYVCIVCP